MSLSSQLCTEQIAELEAIVKNLYTNGNADEQSELLQTWFTDPKYFPFTMQIIESSISDPADSKAMLTHFALRSFCYLLDYISFNLQDLKEISEWSLNIFMEHIDRFIAVPLLMQAFCTTYAQLVIFGWHVSEEFQEFVSPQQSEQFWEKIKSGSAAQWCGQIRLYTGIVEKMAFYHNLETNQVESYRENPLFECFDFAVKTLDIILNHQEPSQYEGEDVMLLVEYSLQLLNSCLSFDYYNAEITKISLPKTWSLDKKLQLYEIADCLFQMYRASPPNLQVYFLKVISLFASIHNDTHSKVIPDRLQYVQPFFHYISDYLNEQNSESIIENENLPLIINIIKKTVLLTEGSDYLELSKMESFLNFIETVSALTKNIFCVKFLMESSDSIINILKFWELISTIIAQCNDDLEHSDEAIEKIKEAKSEFEANYFKKFILEESFVEPVRHIVETVQPLIDEVIESYIQLLTQLVKDHPEDAYEILFSDLAQTSSLTEFSQTNSSADISQTDLSQSNPLTDLVLSIRSSNENKFYRSILDAFNELFVAYGKDPKDSIVELQLGLFAMIIAPPVIQKIRSGKRNKFTRMDYFSPVSSIQQARSSPLFHQHFSESKGESLDLGFGHHDKSSFFITKEANSEAEITTSFASLEDESGEHPIESMLDESMTGLFNLFKGTSELIQNGFTENAYMEEIVIFLIKEITRSTLFNFRSVNDLPKLVSDSKQPEGTFDLNELFIQRIIISISTFSTNNRIISLAMEAIAQWKNSVTIVNELLGVYYSTLAEYFDSMHTKHNRVRFHQIIGQIIDLKPDDQIFENFFERISQRYEKLVEEKDENLALGLILDLRGLVSGTNIAYGLSFDYIFPKLEIFHDMSLEYSSLVIPYLKFLNEFTDKKEARIYFPEHSSNGLKMAKAAMKFCIAFLENAPRSLDKSSKGLFFTMKIMNNIFTSQYSNLGAMIAYNDPILIHFFNSFLNFAHVIDFNDIVRYPKHLVQIIHLMNYLFDHFSNFIVDIDISFLQTALVICTYSDDTTNLKVMDATLQVISSITNCSVKLLGTPRGQELFDNTKETFASVLTMLENCIMKMRFSITYQNSLAHYVGLIQTTKDVLKMSPTNWPEVKQRLVLFLSSPSDERVKKLIDDLVSIEI